MADDLDSIKEMFDEASIDKKIDFLFNTLGDLKNNMLEGFEKMESGFEQVNKSFEGMAKKCECRRTECEQGFIKTFVTKTQARIFGAMVIVFAAGIGIGAGVITFTELIKMVP